MLFTVNESYFLLQSRNSLKFYEIHLSVFVSVSFFMVPWSKEHSVRAYLDTINYLNDLNLTYCRQANVGFCTGFFPFGKFLRGNSLIWNEFQPKYTFFFTKFQFTANISAHFAHQVNFSRFDHIYNFGGPVKKNKWLFKISYMVRYDKLGFFSN